MISREEVTDAILFYVFLWLPMIVIHRLARAYRGLTLIGATQGEWVEYANEPNEGYYPLEPLPFWSLVLDIPRQILLWCVVNRLKALIAWGRKRWLWKKWWGNDEV